MKKTCLPGKYLLLVFLLIFNISFSVAAPVITSFSPSSGPVGTTVIISGSGFNTTPANNAVYFGCIRANVIASNSNLIAVTVPYGATYNYLSATDLSSGLTGYSSGVFVTTFDCGGKIGPSSFSLIPDFQPQKNIQKVAVGDVDNDGKTDLLITNYYSNILSVYRNISSDGVISFAAPLDFATGINPGNIIVSDLDGDGRQDIILINKNSNNISVFRNTSTPGNVSLSARSDVSTGINPYDLYAADFNGDGKPDIAVACNDTPNGVVSVIMNTGTQGNISFAGKVDFFSSPGTQCIKAGDMDGDGKPDIVVTNLNSDNFSIFRNTCVNGVIDINSFAARVDFSTSENPYGVAIGDLDGDGKPDIAIGKSPPYSAISIFRNISTPGVINAGSFAPKVDFPMGTCPNSLSLSDLDGDGKADIAATYYEYNKFALFKNTSVPGTINSGSFAARVEYQIPPISDNLKCADLNADGRPEIMISNSTNGTVAILQNNIMTCPTITSISPESAGEGETVTITGTNLSEIVSVSFGGVSAASFTVVSSTSIKAVVGSGATGNVVVSGYYGTASFPGFKFRDIQSVTFDPLADKTYGETDFDPGAVASSGLAVVYSSSNTSVATIVSGKIHLTGAGTCTIYANQPGNDYFMPAAQVSQNLLVNKKNLTVTGATVVTRQYDSTNGATITGAVLSGIVGSDNVTITNSTSGLFATANAGADITVTTSMSLSGTDAGSYTLTQPGLKGTISPKQIAVIPSGSQSKTYGEADPVLTYTISPSLYGTDAISGALGRVAGENAGTYLFTTGSLTAGSNYSLSTDQSVVFTINKKPVTVTADRGQYKMSGDADPVLTFKYSPALVVNDSFTGALSRDPGESDGNYAITIGTLTAGANYTLTFVSADFAILPSDITPPVVSFPDIEGRTYIHVYDQHLIFFSEIVIPQVLNLSDAIILREGSKTGPDVPFTIVSSDISPTSEQPQMTISAGFKCATSYYLAVIQGSFKDRAGNPVALTEISFNTDPLPEKPLIDGASVTGVNHLCPFTVMSCTNVYSGLTYKWQRDGADIIAADNTEYMLPENAGGIYNLKVTDNITTCENKSDNISIAEYAILKPVIFEKKKSGVVSVLIVDNTSGAFRSYKWTYSDGSPLPSEIASANQFLVLNSSGMSNSYKVTTTDGNGCRNTSDTKAVTLKKGEVTLFPAVNDGNFKVSLMYPDNGLIRCRILNSAGSVVKEQSEQKSDITAVMEIKIAGVPDGVYLVETKLNDFINVSRVVIKH